MLIFLYDEEGGDGAKETFETERESNEKVGSQDCTWKIIIRLNEALSLNCFSSVLSLVHCQPQPHCKNCKFAIQFALSIRCCVEAKMIVINDKMHFRHYVYTPVSSA